MKYTEWQISHECYWFMRVTSCEFSICYPVFLPALIGSNSTERECFQCEYQHVNSQKQIVHSCHFIAFAFQSPIDIYSLCADVIMLFPMLIKK